MRFTAKRLASSLAVVLLWGAVTCPLSAGQAEAAAEKEKPAAKAEPKAPDAERVSFELPMPEEHGGGFATGSAGTFEYQGENFAIASDGVVLRYEDYSFMADTVSLDLATRELTASGNVILDQGPRRLSGDTLVWDLSAKTGTFTEATAYVDPDYYFSGREISKIGENTYSVLDGTFTSCEGDVPGWSFRLGRAEIEVEGYARIHHARMRVKKMPVLYFPYILWPAKTERTSGFLLPNLGYSDRRGAYLGLAYYLVMGRSYDATFHLDLYSEEYYGGGGLFRYRPSDETKGELTGYAINDPLAPAGDEWRWKLLWDHETTNLPFDMRGVVKLREYSDFQFFQDFERGFNVNTVRSMYSNAFASGNWGNHSLNLLADSRETFISADQTILLRQLPEIEYRLRSTRLGNLPLYLQVDSQISYLSQDRSPTYQSDYGRADFFPRLTLPISTWPWLSTSITAGGRVTWYGDTLDETGQAFSGETLTRVVPTASFEIVGPSLSRVYEGKKAKRKHIIEPRWTYGFIGDIDEIGEIPLFDEIDSIRPSNLARIALINRVLSKPNVAKDAKDAKDEEDEEDGAADAVESSGEGDENVDGEETEGDAKAETEKEDSSVEASAREVFTFELSQNYSFDEDRPLQSSSDREQTEAWGPVNARVRFLPSLKTNFELRMSYNTLFSALESTSFAGSFGWGKGYSTSATWFTRWRAETGDKSSDQVRLLFTVPVISDKVKLYAQVNYNIESSDFQQQRYVVEYTGDCFGMRLEYRDYQNGTVTDQDYRFAITLKNVGTFLDLTGGLN